jgi:hypothetical protein
MHEHRKATIKTESHPSNMNREEGFSLGKSWRRKERRPFI